MNARRLQPTTAKVLLLLATGGDAHDAAPGFGVTPGRLRQALSRGALAFLCQSRAWRGASEVSGDVPHAPRAVSLRGKMVSGVGEVCR